MIHEHIEDLEEPTPAAVREHVETGLADVVRRRGVDRVADETDVESERLRALLDGESPTLTMDEAAAILALDDDAPPADVVRAEIEDDLLLGMTTAVLDVDTLAANLDIDADLSGKEVHQRVEGRAPMTVEEYAGIRSVIERRKP